MSSNVDEQLNWLATQYVLGELPEDERGAFELRLADDPAACEAVVEASRMRLALHTVLAEAALMKSGAQPVSRQLSRSVAPTARSSWLAVGVAMAAVACLFIALVFWPQKPGDPVVAGSSLPGGVDHSAVELVTLWRNGMKSSEEQADDADGDLHVPSADVAVPDWLFAAVSLEQHGTVDGPPQEWQDN